MPFEQLWSYTPLQLPMPSFAHAACAAASIECFVACLLLLQLFLVNFVHFVPALQFSLKHWPSAAQISFRATRSALQAAAW